MTNLNNPGLKPGAIGICHALQAIATPFRAWMKNINKGIGFSPSYRMYR